LHAFNEVSHLKGALPAPEIVDIKTCQWKCTYSPMSYFIVKYWEHFIMNVTMEVTTTHGSISFKSSMAWKDLILACYVRNKFGFEIFFCP